MEIVLTEKAKEGLAFWKNSGTKAVLKKIRSLLESIGETPFEGIGKPEPLRYGMAGLWPRRISQEHRLVYFVENETVTVIQLRYHY